MSVLAGNREKTSFDEGERENKAATYESEMPRLRTLYDAVCQQRSDIEKGQGRRSEERGETHIDIGSSLIRRWLTCVASSGGNAVECTVQVEVPLIAQRIDPSGPGSYCQ